MRNVEMMSVAIKRKLDTVRLSCIMPAYNEGDSLQHTVTQTLSALQQLGVKHVELVVVNDGSKDNTAMVLNQLCNHHTQLVVVNLSRNFGKEAALTAGLDVAKGDVVCIMDADGQHPVALIKNMLWHWQAGIDVVYAVRTTRHDQSKLQIGFTRLFYRLINWGSRVSIPADAGDFRLMDACVVHAMRRLPERNRFMKGLYAWVGFSSLAMDYEPLPRLNGKSNFGFKGAFRLALTGLVAFSIAPLRLMAYGGLLLSIVAMLYGGWVIFEHFYFGIQTPGYATLMVSALFLSGIQLLGIGILAEYVGHIYEEVKQRPTYLVQSKLGMGIK